MTTTPRSTRPMRSPSTSAASCSAIRAPTARCCATTSRPRQVRGRTRSTAEEITAPSITRGGRRLGGRRRGRTATSGCGERMPPSSTPTTGARGRRRAGRRGHGGLPRRRDRRSCGVPADGSERHDRGRRRRRRARHARAADRARRRGLRRVAPAGHAATACCGARAPGRSVLDYGGGRCRDQRRPAFVASDDADHPQRDAHAAGCGRCPMARSSPRARTGRSTTAPTPTRCRATSSSRVVHRPEAARSRSRRLRRARGQPRDAARAPERPRPERGRAEHRPGVGDGTGPGLRHGHRSPTTGSGSPCASHRARRERRRFSYAVTDGTAEGGLLSAPDDGHAHRRRRTQRLRPAVVRRRAMPASTGRRPRSRAAAP